MIADFTDALIEAGLPVVGVSVDDEKDIKNCKIQWSRKPTDEEKAQAKAIRESFFWERNDLSFNDLLNKVEKMSEERKVNILNRIIALFLFNNKKFIDKD